MLQYEKLVLGELQTNCYLIWETATKETLIIDPADDGVGISEIIESKQLKPVAILATHGHFDHVMGALDLKLIYNIPFYCSSLDQFLLDRQAETAKHFLKHNIKVPNFRQIDVDLDKTDKVSFLELIKLPGHTPGSVGFYNKENGWLFSGDVIFEDMVGRTDTKYGSKEDLNKSIIQIKKLGEVTIFPGHGNNFEL
ncbi:MAG: MBL fold metallo-hydrolase [Candidatus Shapirobacteria bacterium]|nr:MBL fold metallo-hydrolase [Candidatus Shapirobacteria bacterium]